MKSLADVPVSALNPTPLSVIVGAVLSILITRSSVVATFPATSVASRRLDRQLLTIELSNWCVRLHTTQFRHTELARYIRRPSKHLHRLACRNRKAARVRARATPDALTYTGVTSTVVFATVSSV
jgi:hypothetical protein